MTITQIQMNIILGMVKSIRDDAVILASESEKGYHYRSDLEEKARQQLDFSQRRLQVYLEGLVE